MARFLDTFTGEFHWIDDPSKITYAILSHRWDEKGEQTFTDVEELRKELSATGTLLAHPKLSAKITGICKIAREAGYRLIWIDSCCIDKTKSAELAEALNSMFELYRLATVCYVYLVDVPPGEDLHAKSSRFRQSEWHTRGWTLQEVIAPKNVVFLASDWTFLGTKMTLASTLEQVSGIETEVLAGIADLDSISVARKMSWAAFRKTTRVEDEAYSLLGIFKVYLSPIYGEGRNAFLRLQEEILKVIPDQSLFAWGAYCTFLSVDVVSSPRWSTASIDPGLLAQMPRAFAAASGIRTLTSSQFSSILGGSRATDSRSRALRPPPVHSIITPQGIRTQLMCVNLAQTTINQILCHSPTHYRHRESVCTDCLKLGHATRLALLRCIDEDGYLIALALFESQSADDSELRGTFIATHAKCINTNCRSHTPFRVVRLAGEAWSTLRDCFQSQEPVEVTLLRHGPLPSAIPNRNVFVDLWPLTCQHPYASAHSLATVDLAPECEQVLRSLGCTVLPFVFRRSHARDRIDVTTSLCVPDLHFYAGASAVASLPWALPRNWTLNISQHIDIHLSLNAEEISREHELGGTTVLFVIKNFLHARAAPRRPPAATASSNNAATVTSAACDFCCPVPSQTLAETPVTEERREVFFNHITNERTVVEAVFVVPADTPWASSTNGNTHGTFVRILRLSLQLRNEASLSGPLQDWKGGKREEFFIAYKLWLVVELSQRYLKQDSFDMNSEDLPRAVHVQREATDTDASETGRWDEFDHYFAQRSFFYTGGRVSELSKPESSSAPRGAKDHSSSESSNTSESES